MRLKRSLGAACALCAVTVPAGATAAAQSPKLGLAELPTVKPIVHPVRAAVGLDADLRAAAERMKARDELVGRYADAVREHARVAGLETPSGVRQDARAMTDDELRAETDAVRADTRGLQERLERKAAEAGPAGTASGAAGAPSGALQAIAACESGGDPGAVSPDGTYRGKYQFSRATWQAVGGTGDPAAAPEAVQDRMAAKLYATAGPGQWPVCGR